MQVKITEADVGRVWTYDNAQLLGISSVDVKGNSLGVSYGKGDKDTRARMSISRLEMLFACGRAEWGDCLDDDGDSLVKSGW